MWKFMFTFVLFSAFTPTLLGMGFSAEATLTGDEEVPAVETEGFGGCLLTLVEEDALEVVLFADGLSGPATAAHIHLAPAGQNGPVVLALPLDLPEGRRARPAGRVRRPRDEIGIALLTGEDLEGPLAGLSIADLIAEINAGNAYVNVHTDDHPGGEVRGQLVGEDEFRVRIDLSGSEEVPAVETSATGFARFKLKPKNGNLKFRLSVEGLSSPLTGAHLHLGSAGVNGGVVVVLSEDGPDNELSVSGVLKDKDLEGDLDGMTIADLIVEMRNGNVYVNVHSQENPSGEVRGQVQEDLP